MYAGTCVSHAHPQTQTQTQTQTHTFGFASFGACVGGVDMVVCGHWAQRARGRNTCEAAERGIGGVGWADAADSAAASASYIQVLPILSRAVGLFHHLLWPVVLAQHGTLTARAVVSAGDTAADGLEPAERLAFDAPQRRICLKCDPAHTPIPSAASALMASSAAVAHAPSPLFSLFGKPERRLGGSVSARTSVSTFSLQVYLSATYR